MEYIDIYRMLDENKSLEIQKQGIELARGMKEIDQFVLPISPKYSKNVWLNCAKILAEKTDQELLSHLPKMLEWLQDLNWPGTFIIIDRLKRFNGQLLLNPYIEAVKKACEKNSEDQEWASHLAFLIENQELAILLPSEIFLQEQELYNDFFGE